MSVNYFRTYPVYIKIADLLIEHEMLAEQSSGLLINYGFDGLGMNSEMIRVFKDKGVRMLTASDAHKPENVGMYIREMNGLIK